MFNTFTIIYVISSYLTFVRRAIYTCSGASTITPCPFKPINYIMNTFYILDSRVCGHVFNFHVQLDDIFIK